MTRFYAIALARRGSLYLGILLLLWAGIFFMVRYSHQPQWHFHLVPLIATLPLVLLGGWVAVVSDGWLGRLAGGILAGVAGSVLLVVWVLYATGYLSHVCYSFARLQRVC